MNLCKTKIWGEKKGNKKKTLEKLKYWKEARNEENSFFTVLIMFCCGVSHGQPPPTPLFPPSQTGSCFSRPKRAEPRRRVATHLLTRPVAVSISNLFILFPVSLLCRQTKTSYHATAKKKEKKKTSPRVGSDLPLLLFFNIGTFVEKMLQKQPLCSTSECSSGQAGNKKQNKTEKKKKKERGLFVL